MTDLHSFPCVLLLAHMNAVFVGCCAMCVQVGHVGVHSCQVLRSQQLTAPELLESAAGAGFQPAMTWRLMSAVLGQLTSLPPGQYLLTHQPGSDAVCLFAAALEVELASEVSVGSAVLSVESALFWASCSWALGVHLHG